MRENRPKTVAEKCDKKSLGGCHVDADNLERFIRSAVRDEFGHFISMTRDIGSGSFDRGVEVQRDNHKWMSSQRKNSERISLALKIFILTSALSGLVFVCIEGIKKVLKQ